MPRRDFVTGGRLAPILDLLLPRPCLGCKRGRVEGGLGLCLACEGRLQRSPPTACRRCGRPLVSDPLPYERMCGDCRLRRSPYVRLASVWAYAPPLDAVLQGLKFRRLEYLGARLAAAMAAALGEALADCELVVPVPLHWSRHLRRGYNQAERIAAPMARELGLPCTRALRRSRATPPQSGLGATERRANVARAFRCRRSRSRPWKGRRILLVDDVVTTGATLRAAARALRRGGSGPIVALAAARTPAD